jgi:hypothetical protein
MRTPPASRHVDARTALDYLDRVLDAARRHEVEQHLGEPCAECRERVRALGALLHAMRLDRAPAVPEPVRARAIAAFTPAPRLSRSRAAAEWVAKLLFDSWEAPLAAATRRAVGETRRLRYALGGGTLELECEVEAPRNFTVRGRLAIEDAAVHRVEIASGAETVLGWPNADGAFALERVPAGEARVTIVGPEMRYMVPVIQLEARP